MLVECVLVGILLSQPSGNAAEAARTTLRLALMRGVPVKWDTERNFSAFLRMLDKASDAHADMFVTPECWLDGYAAPDKTSTPERLRGVAQNLNESAYLKRVSEEAGKIFNAAGLWGADGRLIGVYHKTHIQTHDVQFSPGESLPVWPTPWGPIGIMICADRRWPETARTLRLKGARLILNPSYGMSGESNEMWMCTRGYENQCFIAFVHPKVSFLVGPEGNIDARRKGEKAGVLVCDVNLARAKDDNHIRDRRPELYGIITAPKDGR